MVVGQGGWEREAGPGYVMVVGQGGWAREAGPGYVMVVGQGGWDREAGPGYVMVVGARRLGKPTSCSVAREAGPGHFMFCSHDYRASLLHGPGTGSLLQATSWCWASQDTLRLHHCPGSGSLGKATSWSSDKEVWAGRLCQPGYFIILGQGDWTWVNHGPWAIRTEQDYFMVLGQGGWASLTLGPGVVR